MAEPGASTPPSERDLALLDVVARDLDRVDATLVALDDADTDPAVALAWLEDHPSAEPAADASDTRAPGGDHAAIAPEAEPRVDEG